MRYEQTKIEINGIRLDYVLRDQRGSTRSASFAKPDGLSVQKYLFIADGEGLCIKNITMKQKRANTVKQPVGGRPVGVSVTAEVIVLVICGLESKLYSSLRMGDEPSAELITTDLCRQASLRSVPRQFNRRQTPGRSIDNDGHASRIYDGISPCAVDTNVACHLTVDGQEFMLVADCLENRVLLLSPELKYAKI